VVDSGYVLDQLEAERKFLLFAHHQEMLDAVEDAVRDKVRSQMHCCGHVLGIACHSVTGYIKTRGSINRDALPPY